MDRPRHALLATVTLIALATGCRPVGDPPPRPQPVAQPAQATPNAEPAATPVSATAGPEAPRTPVGRTVVVPDFAKVVEAVGPSVVSVVSTVPGPGGEPMRGIGSGVIVSASGQILTNEHVIAGASRLEIELPDGGWHRAKLLAGDPLLDLALLQLDPPTENLPPAALHNANPRPGQWVMAMGHPYGLGNTVTVGVVSGLGRDHADLGRPPGLRPDGIWSFIQTDASINIGNSGGPLVDAEGRVLGISTAVRNDAQGVAFAVPAPMVRRFLDEIWTHGRVRHPRLGIRAENTEPGANGPGVTAVRVTQVEAGGPGALGGLQVGDIIISMDGGRVRRVSDVAYLTQLAGVGAKLDLAVRRGKEPAMTLQVTAVEAR